MYEEIYCLQSFTILGNSYMETLTRMTNQEEFSFIIV